METLNEYPDAKEQIRMFSSTDNYPDNQESIPALVIIIIPALKYVHVELAPNLMILPFSLVPTQHEHTLVIIIHVIYMYVTILKI